MSHSDDQGLVLPPTVAPKQVVIVPIWQEDTQEEVLQYATELAAELESAGVRVHLDDRDERNPGFKYNEWELKGVPVRFEVGPNEVEDGEVTVVHRPDGEDAVEDRADITASVFEHLDAVYDKLYDAAAERLDENVRGASDRNEILGTIGQHGGYVTAPWCGDVDCEAEIKEQIHAEIVMVPLGEESAARAASEFGDERVPEPDHEGEDCAVCGDDAEQTAYFAKSY
jgi:prolyl-tRNA synthetase